MLSDRNNHRGTLVIRRAVVTGGAGFIGAHLCQALVRGGWEVVSIDDLSSGSWAGRGSESAAEVETVEVDITDPGLDRVMSGVKPQVVFHLAAVSSAAQCQQDPARCWEVNVEGTARVLEAAGRSGAAKLVNMSSLAVHGIGSAGAGPSYGLSKRAAEDLVNGRASEAGIGWVNLRLANIYGPRQYGDGESAVVATWLRAMADGDPVFLDGDGQQTRDFLYVADAVEAIIGAADRAEGLTLELGKGVETSLLGLLATMREVTGWQGAVRRRPAREGDIRRSVTDPHPAHEALRWRARTDLAAGLQETWDWMKSG